MSPLQGCKGLGTSGLGEPSDLNILSKVKSKLAESGKPSGFLFEYKSSHSMPLLCTTEGKKDMLRIL